MPDKADALNYGRLLFQISLPQFGTSAASRFYEQHTRDLAVVTGGAFIFQQLGHYADVVLQAMSAYDWTDHPIGEKKAREAADVAKMSVAHRAALSRSIAENLGHDAGHLAITRYADNLNCYLADIIGMALRSYPKTVLDSDAQVAVKDVLQHADMDSVKEWLIDRKLSDLSFQGLPTLEAYCKKQFDFTLFTPGIQRDNVSFIIAARNLIVHRRAIVDNRFLKSAGGEFGSISQRLEISNEHVADLLRSTVRAVQELDARASAHFKWPKIEIQPDPVAVTELNLIEEVRRCVMSWDDVVSDQGR